MINTLIRIGIRILLILADTCNQLASSIETFQRMNEDDLLDFLLENDTKKPDTITSASSHWLNGNLIKDIIPKSKVAPKQNDLLVLGVVDDDIFDMMGDLDDLILNDVKPNDIIPRIRKEKRKIKDSKMKTDENILPESTAKPQDISKHIPKSKMKRERILLKKVNIKTTSEDDLDGKSKRERLLDLESQEEHNENCKSKRDANAKKQAGLGSGVDSKRQPRQKLRRQPKDKKEAPVDSDIAVTNKSNDKGRRESNNTLNTEKQIDHKVDPTRKPESKRKGRGKGKGEPKTDDQHSPIDKVTTVISTNSNDKVKSNLKDTVDFDPLIRAETKSKVKNKRKRKIKKNGNVGTKTSKDNENLKKDKEMYQLYIESPGNQFIKNELSSKPAI